MAYERQCTASALSFVVTDEDIALLRKLQPRIGSYEAELPLPTLSPDERKRRRLAFRNERLLYHRQSDLSQKRIISIFSPDKRFPVYGSDEWWSDAWDARSYGRSFDFSRPFFEQFSELRRAVPQVALVSSPDALENNCPYINFAGNSRNCYMIFDSDFNEDSYYSNVLKHSRDCCDCSYTQRSELCYECVDCSGCYRLRYSQDCDNCSESYFLNSCIGCRDCCFCTNLVQKQFWFANEPCTKEEYYRKLTALNLGSREAIEQEKRRFAAFLLGFPRKTLRILKAENAMGDYVLRAKNVFHSFNVAEVEDIRYCDSLFQAKDCMDVSSFGEQIECVYEGCTIGLNCHNVLFSFGCVLNCTNIIYCDGCRLSDQCFGCAGLRNGKFSVLNKQYSENEYHQLVPKIIEHMKATGEWGEFFPLALSSFGYNETVAQHMFPLDPAGAEKRGANWSTYEPPSVEVDVVPPETVPDTIRLAGDDLTSKAVRCAVTGKPFRIIKQELEFYRRNDIPVPVRSHDVRWQERMSLRNPQRLWRRACAKTGKEILSSYAPDRPEVVYSIEAYLEALL